MSYSIGPITFPFLEAHSWDARRQTQIVNVPFTRQTGFSTGAELVSYSLSGQFYADTEAEAKVLRRQLVELFNNSDIDFEYIEFDCDDEELSGWFLLDQVSVNIPPGSLGPYPFSASVRRLGNLSTHLFGTYWTSTPYTNDYALTGREWVAAPNSLGSPVNDNRPGDGGENYIIVAPSPLVSPITYQAQPTIADFYDMACRAYTIPGTVSIADALNEVASKTEIFSNDHETIRSATTTARERIIISNGLIALAYDPVPSRNETELYVYDSAVAPPSSWVQVALDVLYTTTASAFSYSAQQFRPVFEKVSRDEIIFKVILSNTDAYDQNLVTARYRIMRGSYFVDVHLKTNGTDIDTDTAILGTDALSSLTSGANYSVADVGTKGKVGYLHTETATSTISVFSLRLGYSVAINSETHFGLLLTPPALPTGTTLANLGNEFIANMRQQPVLVDPRWL